MTASAAIRCRSAPTRDRARRHADGGFRRHRRRDARRVQRAGERAARQRVLHREGAARSGPAAEQRHVRMHRDPRRTRHDWSIRAFPRRSARAASPATRSPGALFGAFADCCRPIAPWPRRTTACRRSSSPARAAPATAVSSTWRPSAAAWARGATPMGWKAIHVHLTNTSNLPAEALENEYALLVDEYALVVGFRRRRPPSRRPGHCPADPGDA